MAVLVSEPIACCVTPIAQSAADRLGAGDAARDVDQDVLARCRSWSSAKASVNGARLSR